MDKQLNYMDGFEQNSLGADAQGSGRVSYQDRIIDYRFREIHVSRSQRGISLTIRSQREIQITDQNRQYDISPDPHKDSYYDGHERNFYAILAETAMNEVVQQGSWPHNIRVRNRHFDNDYLLD